MKNTTIPISIPQDIMVALNETEQDLRAHFQSGIALLLFQEQKLTLGKAIELSGLSRFEFEKLLTKSNLTISNPSFNQVLSDLEKLSDL